MSYLCTVNYKLLIANITKMEKETVKDQIKQMEVGQTLSYPIERLTVVRTYACELGMILDRKYKTETDRDNRTINVTRES